MIVKQDKALNRVYIHLNGHYIEVKEDDENFGVIVDVFDDTVAGGDCVSTDTHWKDDLVRPELRVGMGEYEERKKFVDHIIDTGKNVDVPAIDGVCGEFTGYIEGEIKTDTDGGLYVTVLDLEDNAFDIDIMDLEL